MTIIITPATKTTASAVLLASRWLGNVRIKRAKRSPKIRRMRLCKSKPVTGLLMWIALVNLACDLLVKDVV
jgi:hypothetical protein